MSCAGWVPFASECSYPRSAAPGIFWLIGLRGATQLFSPATLFRTGSAELKGFMGFNSRWLVLSAQSLDIFESPAVYIPPFSPLPPSSLHSSLPPRYHLPPSPTSELNHILLCDWILLHISSPVFVRKSRCQQWEQSVLSCPRPSREGSRVPSSTRPMRLCLLSLLPLPVLRAPLMMRIMGWCGGRSKKSTVVLAFETPDEKHAWVQMIHFIAARSAPFAFGRDATARWCESKHARAWQRHMLHPVLAFAPPAHGQRVRAPCAPSDASCPGPCPRWCHEHTARLGHAQPRIACRHTANRLAATHRFAAVVSHGPHCLA